jgi:membrane protease YdiL (CAAX protease family)
VDRRVRGLIAVLVPVLAGWNNLLAPRLGRLGYPAVNAVATGAVLVAGRSSGLSWAELGLDLRRLAAGARAGAALALPLVVGYGVALVIPRLRPALLDARVAALPASRLWLDVLVRIPVGTVVWEETAFRGVLQGALSRLLPAARADLAGAALFGLWHVAPTLSAARANDPKASRSRRVASVTGGCAGTAAAGLLFSALRRRSGSLLAPAMLHLTANGGGLLAAVVAHRLARRSASSGGA